MVEFALSWLLFFMITIVGTMDLGRGIWAHNLLSHAAHAGVRYAITRGSQSLNPATSEDVAAYVRSQALVLQGVDVTATWTPNNKPGSQVHVRVRYQFRPLLRPLLPESINLAATSQMVISN